MSRPTIEYTGYKGMNKKLSFVLKCKVCGCWDKLPAGHKLTGKLAKDFCSKHKDCHTATMNTTEIER